MAKVSWAKGNETRENAAKKGNPYAVLKEDGTELDTASMTEEEFTAIRPGHIGGSGVAAILGISPWTTVTEYYDQFLGIEPKVKASFNETAKALGHENEEFVAQKFVSYMKKFYKMDIELCNDSRVFRNDRYPYAQLNLDRRIVKVNGKKTDMILECKTTGFRNLNSIDNYWKKGICPPYYESQVRFYLKVMNLTTAYICCCWGLTYDEMSVIKIERDDAQDDLIIRACEDFIDCVDQGIVPDETNSNTRLWNNYYLRQNGAPDPQKAPVEFPDTALAIVKNAEQIQGKIEKLEKDVEAEKSKLQDVLKALLGLTNGAEYGSVSEDDEQTGMRKIYGVKFKAPMKRAKFDEEKFILEHPELVPVYQKVTIDTTLLGKKDKKLKAEYTLPPEVDGTKDYSITLTTKEIPIPKK